MFQLNIESKYLYNFLFFSFIHNNSFCFADLCIIFFLLTLILVKLFCIPKQIFSFSFKEIIMQQSFNFCFKIKNQLSTTSFEFEVSFLFVKIEKHSWKKRNTIKKNLICKLKRRMLQLQQDLVPFCKFWHVSCLLN